MTLLFLGSIILAFVVLSKAASCPCGVIGVPKDGKVSKDKDLSCDQPVTYSCIKETILIGDRQRKCEGDKFTSSTPTCMPFIDTNGGEDFQFHGTGLNVLNNTDSMCIDETFAITFNKMLITNLFVLTNTTCKELTISTDSEIVKETTSIKSGESATYSFTVNKPVAAINISQSECCLYRVVFADPSVSIRCGTPDIPDGVKWDKTTQNKITFRCDKGDKVDGPESITCIGLEQWSHGNETVKCVSDHSSIWIIILVILLLIGMIVLAFYLGNKYIHKSEVGKCV